MNIVNYLHYRQDTSLPPITAVFYDYITAANGIFVRAKNNAFYAHHPAICLQQTKPIAGLCEMNPVLLWKIPKVPITLLTKMVKHAKGHIGEDGKHHEALYHIRWDIMEKVYELHTPEQIGGTSFTYSTQTETPDGYITVADFHSHGRLEAIFSDTDNKDETRFRFYGVIGKVNQAKPDIALRFGIYGHWHQHPLSSLFSYTDQHQKQDWKEVLVANRATS